MGRSQPSRQAFESPAAPAGGLAAGRWGPRARSRLTWIGAAAVIGALAASVVGLSAAGDADSARAYVVATGEPAAVAAAGIDLLPGADPAISARSDSTTPPPLWPPQQQVPDDITLAYAATPAAATATPSPTREPDLVSMRVTPLVNVQQYWSYTCVAAAIQTELYTALGSFDTSAAEQMAIYEWGRAHLEFGLYQPGLDFIAWARALNHFGAGKVRYRGVAEEDASALLRRMARAMRASGLPQGAGVVGGTHAWTIAGFVTTADPATVDTFSVVGVYVAGPNLKHRDPPTLAYVSAAALVAFWEVYKDPYGSSRYDGKYLAVVGVRT